MSLKSYNTPVRVGQLWEDCDKRMGGRTRRVIAIEGDKAVMNGHPITRVSLRRMWPNSTGWRLIEEGRAPFQPDAASLQKQLLAEQERVRAAEDVIEVLKTWLQNGELDFPVEDSWNAISRYEALSPPPVVGPRQDAD